MAQLLTRNLSLSVLMASIISACAPVPPPNTADCIPAEGTQSVLGTDNGLGDETNVVDEADPSTTPTNILATVDDRPITEELFREAAARIRPADGVALSLEEKNEILGELIDDAILYQRAYERGIQDTAQVQAVMIRNLVREEVFSQVRSSEFGLEELQAYFEEHIEDFIVPAKVQLRRILIRVDEDRDEDAALAEATRLYREIAQDAQRFGALAGEFSEDQYRRRQGELGWVTEEGKPGLDQEVVDLAFRMEPGQLSEPFLSPDGYNIIYVVVKRDRMDREFEEVRGAVIRRLRDDRLDQTYDNYISELRESANISIVSTRIEELEVRGRPRNTRSPHGSTTVPSTNTSDEEVEEVIEGIRRGER